MKASSSAVLLPRPMIGGVRFPAGPRALLAVTIFVAGAVVVFDSDAPIDQRVGGAAHYAAVAALVSMWLPGAGQGVSRAGGAVMAGARARVRAPRVQQLERLIRCKHAGRLQQRRGRPGSAS